MSAFAKEIRRSITHSLGRFIALFAISALGVGFYAGLLMTGPDMRSSTDDYYDGTHFMDIRILSTLGVDDEDIAAIRAVEGVEEVMPAYETDILGTMNGEQYVFRVQSVPDSAASATRDGVVVTCADDGYLNRLLLEEGTWPTRAGECVISGDRVMAVEPQVGDIITVTACSGDLEETLTVREFRVTGFVKSPEYISGTMLGSSSLGSGNVGQFLYTPESSFGEDYSYTDIFVRVEGAADLFAISDEYKDRVAEVEERISAMAPALAEARTARVKAPYEEELADAEAELAEGQAEYEDGLAEYEDGQAEYEDGKAEYESKLAEWQRGMAAYRSGLAEYNENLSYYEQAIDLLEQARTRAIEEGIDEETANAAYELGVQALAELKTQLDEAKSQLDSSYGTLAWAKSQLDEAASELDGAAAELADAAAELADALLELEDGQAEIDDARRELAEMEPAEYYVLDRTQNFGAVSHEQDSSRIDSIARVFPFIFFLVAALVALTTMTRMVEEERSLIGTYKALGYGKGRIIAKYLIYAFAASATGAIVGILALSQVLPRVIQNAYGIVYFVPEGAYPVDLGTAAFAGTLGVGVILAATYFAAASTLREKPSVLLMPRTPKAGKRIFLEHVTPIWNHLSFSWKVTFRNMFRYKKRLFMTVIGIAGCTMLLLTGWGLKDSINDIIDNQFGEIVHYNLGISTEDELTDEDHEAIWSVLENPEYVTESTQVQKLSVIAVQTAGTTDISVEILVPKSRMAFADFITMRNRQTGAWLDLTESGVIVTEKLAKLAGVEVGDRLMLWDQDATGNRTTTGHSVRVAGITENYLYDYVYMSPALYEEVWGEEPVYNMVLAKATDDEAGREELTAILRDVAGVKTVTFNDELIETYRTMLSVVTMITWVLIIAAAALAFIVLYNLTNINITERMREIATLKVLGFTRREVYAYIFREIALLTILGALVGLVLGVFMEGWVVVTAEVNQVMFGREIHLFSYLISLALTGVFSAFVMFVMRHKLNNVNMVESLKAVE